MARRTEVVRAPGKGSLKALVLLIAVVFVMVKWPETSAEVIKHVVSGLEMFVATLFKSRAS
jgi:hypothetical protein